eukprot:TRINITY_DN16089_c0_g2_i1.p1 TRINITY_DN16089_c0_g2~~TRINITY_DN16089_c0_g2_i1.p1  ORF type:complete len:203 (+),score=18.48 TRINITY_DN16089_c0_g2_i1:173-781(+)
MKKELGFFCPFPCCCFTLRAKTSAVLILLFDIIATAILVAIAFTYFRMPYALVGLVYIAILVVCLGSVYTNSNTSIRCVAIVFKYLYSLILLIAGILAVIEALWVSQTSDALQKITSQAKTRKELSWVLMILGLVMIAVGILSAFLCYTLQLALVISSYEVDLYNHRRSGVSGDAHTPIESKDSRSFSLPGKPVNSIHIQPS